MVDDDQKLADLLTKYLSNYGFDVSACLHPIKGIRHIEKYSVDLVILDVMMPDMDGFEFCRMLRKFSSVPVIMLTARGDINDKVVGLELGADDYLSKPFEPRELIARIQTLFRRIETERNSIDKELPKLDKVLALDKQRREIKYKGELLELTSKEYDVLCLFIESDGKVLSREFIIENLRGIDWSAFDRSVDVLISRVRKKLKSTLEDKAMIKTVWGNGYKWIEHED